MGKVFRRISLVGMCLMLSIATAHAKDGFKENDPRLDKITSCKAKGLIWMTVHPDGPYSGTTTKEFKKYFQVDNRQGLLAAAKAVCAKAQENTPSPAIDSRAHIILVRAVALVDCSVQGDPRENVLLDPDLAEWLQEKLIVYDEVDSDVRDMKQTCGLDPTGQKEKDIDKGFKVVK